MDLRRDPEDHHWHIALLSDQVRGTVRVPSNREEEMVADLDRLRLGGEALIENDLSVEPLPRVAPAQLPALRLSSRDTVVEGVDFGQVELQTSPTPNGLFVDTLTLQSEVLQAKAQGTWLSREEREFSRFTIDARGEHLGKILSLFGYGGEIARGRSMIKINGAKWPGSPLDFSIPQMKGELLVQVEQGQLRDVDQGVGRVFGLLGIHTLVRRLTLDFSDITDKGFAFDTIGGVFTIHGGDAYTHDLVIDGPTATIKVEGRIGLIQQDYDQTVTVIPKLSESLPATGALVGGPTGALIGSALLLYDKLFQQDEGLGTTRYRLLGSWDEPILEEVRPRPPVIDSSDSSDH